MVWDKTRPDGSRKLNLSDDDLRENNDGLETGLDTEHVFATGGAQHLRHRFGRGDGTTRDLIADWVAGSIWINTGRVSGEELIDIYDGAAWVETSFGIIDVAQGWSSGQASDYVVVTPGAGTPMTLAWDIEDGNFFKATLSAGTEMQVPDVATLYATGAGAHYTWEITQDAGVARSLTFSSTGPTFFPAYGSQPDIDQALGSVTFVHLTLRSDKTFVYRVENTA